MEKKEAHREEKLIIVSISLRYKTSPQSDDGGVEKCPRLLSTLGCRYISLIPSAYDGQRFFFFLNTAPSQWT